MKILQSSNIYLGRSFTGTGYPGERLRSSIKSAFSRIIDLAREQSVDLVILAGDVFANNSVSQNLIDFFLSEVKRIEEIPVVMQPGAGDNYEKESFWALWKIFPPAKNLYVLTDPANSVARIPERSAAVYGFPTLGKDISWPHNIRKDAECKFHIAVVFDDLPPADGKSVPFKEKLALAPFDYLAIGGRNGFVNLVESGIKGAYSGSPLTLDSDWTGSGNVALVDLGQGPLKVEKIPQGDIVWKELDIPMETVANMDELKMRILEAAGENVMMKVSLSGLALLEAGVNFGHLKTELESNFLNIEFVDKTSVLPDNVSAIKVREKSILGQYLKIMIQKLNESTGAEKRELEESLKVGYALLSGREIW